MATMKLGTETGSLMNHIISGTADNVPVVGLGATELHWTDRTAWFVNWVSKDGKECEIERPKCIRTDGLGMSDSQDYRYERVEDAYKDVLRFKYGKWRSKTSGKVYKIKFGRMDEYYDFSF